VFEKARTARQVEHPPRSFSQPVILLEMLHEAKRRISWRDTALVAVGAFSAFCLLSLTSRGSYSISWHGKDIPSKLAPTKDSEFYEDWSRGSDIDMAPKTQSWPSTRVINHAPGWTMFKNLYMSNGTLFIVISPHDELSPLGLDRGMPRAGWEHGFPLRRMMTSTGAPGYATEESVRAREPTDKDMSFISSEDAERRWGDRIWEISGNTVRIFLLRVAQFVLTVPL
jgi:hypothetical protein